jgi:VIT1/CCC1 family predicted Fe2+/Mn2+ transporter
MTRTRVLDPVSRASEILFGLIMVLTFTASLNTAEMGRGDVRLMLIAALGCNLAWGSIDAAMYLLSVRAEESISQRTLDRIQRAPSPDCAHDEIRAALPPILAGLFHKDDLERIRLHLAQTEIGDVPRLTAGAWRAACAVFLLVFCATLPVALPFLLIGDPRRALWVSHGIAIASLFLAGWSLGRHWLRSLRVGLAMVALGLALVAIALLLGG